MAFAVVTGGGTAGHVLPALAVADALVAAGHTADTIHYVGCTRGIETELLPATPYPHHFFDVVGFQRSLRRGRTNAEFGPKLLRARRAAVRLLRELQPRVIVSVGGYASMPAVLAARTLDIPVVVVSYDLRPGRASQVAARKAVASATAFPDSPLPRAELTGAPVRQAILAVDRSAAGRAAARVALGLPDDRFVGRPTRPVRIRMPHRGFVYDVRAGKPLGETDSVEMTLVPGQAKLLALLPYDVAGIQLRAAPEVRAGADLDVEIVFPSSVPPQARHCVRVGLFDPQRQPLGHYAQNALAGADKIHTTIPLALNDALGQWAVRATDIATGRTTETAFTVIAAE